MSTLKPLPPSILPIAGTSQLTAVWENYFTAVDKELRQASTFPTPEAALNNAAGQTLTAAQFLAGILLRTGPAGAFSDTTPTAVQIIAAIVQADINTNRLVMLSNGGGGLMTLLAGSGVTLQGNTTIAAGYARFYLVTVTAKAAGSEAVNIRGLMTGTM